MVKSNFTGKMRASIGRSLSMSCSCKLMVLVEMTAFFRWRHGEQNGRNQIGQALADARAGLDHQMFLLLQRLRHGHGHFLLLRAVFKIAVIWIRRHSAKKFPRPARSGWRPFPLAGLRPDAIIGPLPARRRAAASRSPGRLCF